jgi:hypothetical protein
MIARGNKYIVLKGSIISDKTGRGSVQQANKHIQYAPENSLVLYNITQTDMTFDSPNWAYKFVTGDKENHGWDYWKTSGGLSVGNIVLKIPI